MDTRQQPIQGDEAGFTGEERIEAARQLPAEPFAWLSAIGFQSGVERPESGLYAFLFPPLVIGEGIQLVDQPLGVNPAQGMPADIELTGVVAEDHGVGQQSVRLDGAPQSAFGGDPHRLGMDVQGGNAKLLQVGHPGPFTGKAPGFTPVAGRFGQAGNHRAGQIALMHVGKGRRVEYIVPMPGLQQLQEVQTALGKGRANPGERIIADLRRHAVAIAMPGAGVVHADPGCAFQAGAQDRLALGDEIFLALVQEPHDLALGDINAEITQ